MFSETKTQFATSDKISSQHMYAIWREISLESGKV